MISIPLWLVAIQLATVGISTVPSCEKIEAATISHVQDSPELFITRTIVTPGVLVHYVRYVKEALARFKFVMIREGTPYKVPDILIQIIEQGTCVNAAGVTSSWGLTLVIPPPGTDDL